ncbi:MAG TPA: carbon storage regulator CsrA, partial [Thermoanaerobacterales bacterium]|nr:carbon storage regulator CsrA [Thermoanaerobacterales bacterium]
MLVLARRVEEGILIGNDIIIKILEIDKDRVKIGVEAPKSMKVLRLELYEDVSIENKKAIDVTKDMVDEF